jgi:hypothetical protein
MDLFEALKQTTSVFRKGPEVEHRDVDGVKVTEVWGYPHVDDHDSDLTMVDVHYVQIGVRHAEDGRQALVEWLSQYPQPERLAGGPSYIELAGVGEIEQETAFRVMALGKVLGLWSLITPETLGITGPEADQMAGMGLVMISGYAVPAAA